MDIDDKYYLAPVSSNKNSTRVLLNDKTGKIISSIRINYMIPVTLNDIKPLIINSSNFDDKRKYLLRIELDDCHKKEDKILLKAEKIYNQISSKLLPKYIASCDCKKLEIAWGLYPRFKEFNEAYLIDNDITIYDLNLDILDDQLVINNSGYELAKIDSYTDISELVSEIMQQ